MIVLKTVVLVPSEHHAAGSSSPSALREGVWVGRGQNVCSRRGASSLAWSAKHFSQSVRRQASTQHVTHVAVPKPCRSEGWRGWVAVVAPVSRPLCSGERWVVWLWGSPSITSTCRRNRGSVASLGFRWRLTVVQVSMWRWLWRLGWSLVWGQDGHCTNFRH